MKSKVLRNIVFLFPLLVFLILWYLYGDFVGALLFFIVIALAFFLIAAVLAFLFSFLPSFLRDIRGISYEDHISSLIANEKAKVEDYKTYNSIVFEDLSTGCTAYLIDVGKNKLLILYGQDYGFEPINEEIDIEFNQPRAFPTETFSLARKIKDKNILKVTPYGEIIEPTIIDEPNIKGLFKFGIKLKDGSLLQNMEYEKILNVLQE